jgi:tricarballylate dehydrogenase
MSLTKNYDVLVVGAGNAGFAAAHAAREHGIKVAVLECSPEDEAGGNSSFTAGAMRVVYNGVEDLLGLMPDLSEDEIKNTDFGSYTEEQFFDDMGRVTEYRTDPDLCELLVKNSYDTLKWMNSKGIRFVPIYGRQAFKIDGKFKFWGGLTVEASGGGPGLIEAWTAASKKQNIDVFYETRALELLHEDGKVTGALVRQNGKTFRIEAHSTVLASGGFEANTEWRTRYLGPNWDLAKVRGSRYNMGDGIRMALDIGASPAGNWSGCHAVGWDRNAPEFGDLAVGDGFQKHSYPFGIMINAKGERFVDEGADFRNYTYAKYGREILKQPGNFAYQIFDEKVLHLLRDEYRIRQVTKVTSDSLEGLLADLDNVDPSGALENIQQYNAAVQTDVPFNPNIKDGRGTKGLTLPKSNWANTIDTPPFHAYGITCGITFTFGGLRINQQANVLNTDHKSITGLYAAGELVGALFYSNYPGGTGLTSGSVFGRIAGDHAGQLAKSLA